jgi:hypothetical protein
MEMGWIFEVPHSRRAHASLGQAVVEPCGGSIAKVGTDHLMNRAEYLKQNEYRAGEGERTGTRTAALHRAYQHTHCDSEHRREDSSQKEGSPPGGGQAGGRLRQDAEEDPFLALSEGPEHERILTPSQDACPSFGVSSCACRVGYPKTPSRMSTARVRGSYDA